MTSVNFPILRISLGQFRVLQDQQILRVVFFGRFGEIERAGEDGLTVHHHHLVVGNAVFGINQRGNSGMSDEIPFPQLACVENGDGDMLDGMSDIKLFRIGNGAAREIQGTASHLEKPLQHLIEANLEPLLGIRFLATEYSTGKTHAGRIDTLGLDENNSPVIIEYKRSSHENIINQGLFYFDWLMDHQAEFKLCVLEKFGKSTADAIDWTAPRLICIAADFTKYDSHAVQQMDRNIELLRYRQFGKELLLFELVNAVAANGPSGKKVKTAKSSGADKSVAEWLADLTPAVREVFESLEGFLFSLGDDVQRKDLKIYIVFKRLRNFATVCFQKNNLVVYLHVDPEQMEFVDGFSRDMREIGHWGTGSVEVTIKNLTDLDKAKPLLLRAYEGSSQESQT